MPTEAEVYQLIANFFSDKSNWGELEALFDLEGIDCSLKNIMEFMKNPLKKKYNNELNIVIKGIYDSLQK